MVDEATVDELFDMTMDDFDVIVELFAKVDDVLDVVVEVFVVDGMRFGAPLGAGAPLTTRSWKSIQKPNIAMEARRFMAVESACGGEGLIERDFPLDYMNYPWFMSEENCVFWANYKIEADVDPANDAKSQNNPDCIEINLEEEAHWTTDALCSLSTGREMVACGEDRRHASGSTKKEGLKFGFLLTTQRPGRASQNEVVCTQCFPANKRDSCRK